VSCGRRRDGASWLAWMSIRSGRYVPSSENPPGQPVALECPQRPGRDVGPAAEFVRQFCFRRQPGPRRVFAVPDPPREHGVNVRVGLRVPPRIIQTSHTGSVTAQPRRTPCAPSGTPARGHTSGMVYARVTTSPGRRRVSTPSAACAGVSWPPWKGGLTLRCGWGPCAGPGPGRPCSRTAVRPGPQRSRGRLRSPATGFRRRPKTTHPRPGLCESGWPRSGAWPSPVSATRSR